MNIGGSDKGNTGQIDGAGDNYNKEEPDNKKRDFTLIIRSGVKESIQQDCCEDLSKFGGGWVVSHSMEVAAVAAASFVSSSSSSFSPPDDNACFVFLSKCF